MDFLANIARSIGIRLLFVILVFAVIGGGMWVWDSVRSTHYLYIDNTAGHSPQVVSINGVVQTTVPSGKVEIVYCRAGNIRLTVIEAKVVLDRSIDLKPLEYGDAYKYIVNAAARHGYHVREIVFGSPIRVPDFHARGSETERLLDAMHLIDSQEVIDFTDSRPEYVLTDEPPSSIETSKFLPGETHQHVVRLPREDYDFLWAMSQKHEHTEDEASRVRAIVEKL